MAYEPPRDREIIVTNTGGGDGGAGTVVAVIIGLLAVVFLVWALFFSGWVFNGGGEGGDGDGLDVNVNVNDPTVVVPSG